MAKYDSRFGIINGVWSDPGPCDTERRLIAELMEAPDTADLAALRAHDLAFAPLPENRIREFYPDIFACWPERLRAGVLVFSDYSHGRLEQPDETKRLTLTGRVAFDDDMAFLHSGFMGRYLVWIDYPNVLMTNDMHEFSGFCASRAAIARVFGRPLKALVDDFSAYAQRAPDEDGGPYYQKLAALYASQDLS